jgi:protein-tyrosine phosphatase
MAEMLTRQAMRPLSVSHAAPLLVSSAGVRAIAGQHAHPYAVASLAALGVRTDGFAARPLTSTLVSGSDLVLTATGRHRDAAVELVPGASRRTFTILEFARISAHLPGARATAVPGALRTGDIAPWARSVVGAVAMLRGQVGFVPPAADDIPDPPRRKAAFRLCARDIASAVEACADALVPGRRGDIAETPNEAVVGMI